jgi:hypothetical protein
LSPVAAEVEDVTVVVAVVVAYALERHSMYLKSLRLQ